MDSFSPNVITLVVVVAGLGLITFAVVTMTSFIKISVVMFLLRNALGIQQTPPNIVLYGIALVLTVFISAPLAQQVYSRLDAPNMKLESFQDWIAASEKAREPVREYLTRFTGPGERDFFLNATKRVWPKDMHETATSSDLAILIPSFVITELRRAFEIGFLIYLPFIAIDLIISAILMALGMSMVPPITISVPFKLFLFVAIEGWSKLFHGLVLSYA
ncbi:type III secretion system export apparatus subunit SctR [Rhodomicrobium vannielii ATCC 17100]|uniref:type III secretion system export apparatus subunit SctR n=1 Tax=Rhodomicrobium vannielii TaxID=1069 RepID=UPI00191B12F6|nr:type III secretion system export apparatus subunit SctR [Rhodomicrobium vannielii]MBJ7533114.1 type III secretion system export apparatus subunit SctR [Rhodomicrobium vannielii ATCC 17100]